VTEYHMPKLPEGHIPSEERPAETMRTGMVADNDRNDGGEQLVAEAEPPIAVCVPVHSEVASSHRGIGKSIKETLLLLLLLALPIVAGLSLVLQWRWWTSNPSQEEWLAVADYVRSEWMEGDVLRVEPAWATGALRYFDGLALDRMPSVEPRELHHYRRLWVIYHLGHHPPAPGIPPAFERLDERSFGNVFVETYKIEGTGKLLYDMRERLAEAAVRRLPPKGKTGPVEECNIFIDGAWHCGAVHQWQNVKPDRFFVGRAGRDVIWAHPLNKGRRLEILWPEVPLASILEIQVGWTSAALQSHHKGTPVTVEVFVGEKQVLSDTISPERREWTVHEIDVRSWAGKKLPVRIVNSTQDHRVRQLVFVARSWQD